MNKVIRPAGIIAFVAIVGMVAAFWYLLADWLLKAAVEEGGSRLVGAKVEVASADTSFSPLGFTLTRLQVTNPDHPMQNMLEVNTISGKLTLSKLLMGQVIIEDLSATGMRFNTPRQTSGKLEKRAAKKPAPETAEAEQGKESHLNLLALLGDTLNIDDIMQREPLATVELSKAFKESVATSKRQIKQDIETLPDEAKLKAYERQVNDITQGKIQSVQDLQHRVEQLKQLKQSLQQDRKAILALRDNIRHSKVELKTQYDALKQAPKQDVKKIQDKYRLVDSNIGNFSALLFGDTTRKWLDAVKPWWRRANNLMQTFGGEETPPPPPRGEGRYIHFPSREPMPDFLIQNAHLSAQLPLGNVEIKVVDATTQQYILGRPTRLSLRGTQLIDLDSFSAEAVLDHVKPKAAKDSISFLAKDIRLQNVPLIKSDTLPISLAKANTDIKGQLDIAQGQLQADVESDFKQAQWASGGKNANTVMDVLSGITSFNVDTTLKGKPLSPHITVDSDLDRKLSQALRRKLEQKRAELKQRLEKRLKAQVDKLAGPYKEQLAYLTQGEGDIDQRLQKVEAMLKTEVKSTLDSKKQELQQKSEQKLEEKKKEAEQKAEEELKKKAKDALKKFGF
jgi:uncharacterized protein (TIGR03545 family)